MKTVLPCGAQAEEHVADVAAADRVDAVGGLVEQDQVGVVDQRLGEADALGHAFGIRADSCGRRRRPCRRCRAVRRRALSAGAAVDLGEGAEEFDHLPAGQVAGEAVVFRKVADAAERRLVADGLAEHRAARRGRADDGHHDLDERALARAVGAEQAEDLAAADVHLDPREGVDAALVALGDVVEVDGEVVGGVRSSRVSARRCDRRQGIRE